MVSAEEVVDEGSVVTDSVSVEAEQPKVEEATVIEETIEEVTEDVAVTSTTHRGNPVFAQTSGSFIGLGAIISSLSALGGAMVVKKKKDE